MGPDPKINNSALVFTTISAVHAMQKIGLLVKPFFIFGI